MWLAAVACRKFAKKIGTDVGVANGIIFFETPCMTSLKGAAISFIVMQEHFQDCTGSRLGMTSWKLQD